MNFGKTAPCARFAKCMPKVLNCSPAFMRNTGFTPSTVTTILPNAVPTLADVVFLRASAGRSSVKSAVSRNYILSGIILKDCAKKTSLLHGHQSDLLNSTFWRLSRFLVRYVWRPLESLESLIQPVPPKPHKEKCYGKEAVRMGKTARTDSDCRSHPPPRYRKPYLSVLQHRKLCIPAGITAIEIENRCMTLIKWSQGTRSDMCLQVLREPLGSPLCIDDFCNN